MHALRSTLLSTLATLLVTVTAIPGAAHAAREQRATGDFQAIASSGAFDLRVRQGERTSVEVEGDEQAVAQVETVVESGSKGAVLKIRQRPGSSWRGSKAPVIHVTTAQLTSVSLSGAGDLQLEAFKTPELVIALSGSGDASLRSIDAEQLRIRIAGSGDVSGDGRAARLTLSIAGSGEAKLRDLKSSHAEVSIAGSGDAEVHADQSLDVRIAGSGDVRYAGNATVKSKVVGSGSTRQLR